MAPPRTSADATPLPGVPAAVPGAGLTRGPANPGDGGTPDAELAGLPSPRRPWRRLTLVLMVVTLVASLALLMSLRGELSFSLGAASPRAVGELASFRPTAADRNTWIRATGELARDGAVAYRRPLEADSYRLSRVVGHPQLWVQVRVPPDDEDPHHRRFVPPTSFVGRLVPADAGGVRLSQLPSAIAEAKRPPLPPDAWLLIDGEAPATTRWTVGLAVLLAGFALFNLLGLVRLLRPAMD